MRSQRSAISGDQKPSIFVSLGLAEPPSGRHPSWLVRAPTSIARIWPLVVLTRFAILAAIAHTTVLAWLRESTQTALLCGLGLMLIDAAITLLLQYGPLSRRPPHSQMRWLVGLVFISGLAFSSAAALALSAGSRADTFGLLLAQILPALVAISIFGGQRILGFVYCAATLIPILALHPQEIPVTIPLAGLIGLLFAAIAQARVDQTNLVKRQKNAMRGEQALALLTDFEEAGQGWFWETDRNGNLTYVSATLARRTGKSVSDILGTPMTGLIDQGSRAGQGEGERTIGFHLSARSAFSEIAVRAAMTGEELWWSISGRPVVSEFGQFLGFRGSGADLTEMRKSQAEVARLARYDSLTGLANRVQMLATLEQSVIDSMGRQGNCALFILDLDRFKGVNDTMGHPAGDALLRQVAQRLLRVVGNHGKVGRLGGDEFQVVLPGMVDRPELAKLAETIIHAVSQPYTIEGVQVVIGVSVGIAVAPTDGSTSETLIRNADLALYKAKDGGRGAFRFYSQDMHADAEDRRQLEQDLRHAINTGGLHVEYQAVVASSTEKISGFETLVRWNHPVRGPISPAYFIPIAEEAGLITQIGEWVLRTACNDAVSWPNDIRVAVNVSPIQFGNPAFPALVVNALAKSGLQPERLELEITESVFLDDSGNTDAMFASLKHIGVRLALDDFGTGYSALGYLKTAPFDKIKIDQSFVRGAAIKGSRNGAIVQSIVSLAEALSMETTAEGAETLDELELIRKLGCSHIQGYIYGRPTTNDIIMAQFAAGEFHARPSGFKASRPPRRTMLRSIKLVHGDSSFEARVRNISNEGAMVEGLADVPVGTAFNVVFNRNYSLQATCKWTVGDRMGLEFSEPVRIDLASRSDEKPARPSDADDMRRAG